MRDNLVKTRIAPDLLAEMGKPQAETRLTPADPHTPVFQVIIEVNTDFPGGPSVARAALQVRYHANRGGVASAPRAESPPQAIPAPAIDLWPALAFGPADEIDERKSGFTETYLFARLTEDTIERL